MLQSNQHEIQEIQIIDHEVQLNLSRLLDAEKMPYVEKETTILHKKIAHNAMALSQLMHKTENKMMSTDQELEKLNIPISKNKTIHIAIIIKILMFLATMNITFLIIICIYTKCCDCLIKRIRKQEVIEFDYIPARTQRQEREQRLRLDHPYIGRSPYVRQKNAQRIKVTQV